MKLSYTLIAAALLSTTALAGTPAVTLEQAPEFKRLSGSLTGGYATNYTGRGYVVSHSVAEGDSVLFAALKTSYDFGFYIGATLRDFKELVQFNLSLFFN